MGRRRKCRFPAGATKRDGRSKQSSKRQQGLGNRRLSEPERARRGDNPTGLVNGNKNPAVADLKVFVHQHPVEIDPIGISDVLIVVLDSRAPRSKDWPSTAWRMRLKKFCLNTALLVVDIQIGFDDPRWGSRNNPGAEGNVAQLIAAWRAAAMPVIHVHHDSLDPAGLLRRGAPGNAPKSQAKPLAGEAVYRKRVNSAFIGTNLEVDLRNLGIEALVIVGLTTNHCVSTTARMASNLGFKTFVIADATATFDRAGLDGILRGAEEVHAAALSDLQSEFAIIADTRATLASLDNLDGLAASRLELQVLRQTRPDCLSKAAAS